MSVLTIYNTYLHPLSVEERLALIRLLVDQTIVAKDQAEQNPLLRDVMDFAGAGKDYLMDEDAQVYIDNLRSEWE